MKASNHAVRRYVERELDLVPAGSSRRTRPSDRAVLRELERAGLVDIQAARREIERVFEHPRLVTVAGWANGAQFRVIVGGRVYCCRGDAVTTFYRETPKGQASVDRSRLRRRPAPANRI